VWRYRDPRLSQHLLLGYQDSLGLLDVLHPLKYAPNLILRFLLGHWRRRNDETIVVTFVVFDGLEAWQAVTVRLAVGLEGSFDEFFGLSIGLVIPGSANWNPWGF
jgi:hypothetical protein